VWAPQLATGAVIGSCGQTRAGDDIEAFMDRLAEQYKDTKKIHIVWDNLNIYYDGTRQRRTKFNAAHDGSFVFPYTPIHASWVH